MQFKRGDVVYVHYSKHRHCPAHLWDGVGVVMSTSKDGRNGKIAIVEGFFNSSPCSGGFDFEVLELLGHIDLEEGERCDSSVGT